MMKKIIVIIYTVSVAVTALCALVFRPHINIILDSLAPVAVTLFCVIMGLLIKSDIICFRGGRFRYTKSSVGFKYSKNKYGEGEFTKTVFRNAPDRRVQNVFGYAYIITGALPVPAVFFFPMTVKWGSIGLVLIPLIIGTTMAFVSDMKETKAALEEQMAKEDQWRKELEEQKRREEMGKWK